MNLFAKGKGGAAPAAKGPAFSPIDRFGLLGLLDQIVNGSQSGVLELHEPRGTWTYAFQNGALTHASGGVVRGARQAFDLLWEFQAGEFLFSPGTNPSLAGNLYIDKGRLLDLLRRSQAVLQGPSAPYIPPDQQRPIAPVPRPYTPPSPAQMPPAWQPGMQQQPPWPGAQPGQPPLPVQPAPWANGYPQQPGAAPQPFPAQSFPGAPGQPYPGAQPPIYPGAPAQGFPGQPAPTYGAPGYPGSPAPLPPAPPGGYPPVRGNVRQQAAPPAQPAPPGPAFAPAPPPAFPPQPPAFSAQPPAPVAPARPLTPPSFSVPPMPIPKKSQSAPVYQPPAATPPAAPAAPEAAKPATPTDDLAALRASLVAQAPPVKPAPAAGWGVRTPEGTVAPATAGGAPTGKGKDKAKAGDKKKKGDSKLKAAIKLQLIKFLLWACERRYDPEDRWTLKDAFEVSTMELRDQFFGAFSQTFASTKKNSNSEDGMDDMAAGRMRGRGRRH